MGDGPSNRAVTREDGNMRTARIVHDIAVVKHVKPGQIALVWLLQKGDDIVPIPGTKQKRYLEKNVATETVQLDPAQMNALADALAPGKVSGQRYADWIRRRLIAEPSLY